MKNQENKKQLRDVLEKAFLQIVITHQQFHLKTEKKDMTKVRKRRNGYSTFLNTIRKVKDGLPGLLTASRALHGVEKRANLGISREDQYIPLVRMPPQKRHLLVTTRSSSTPGSP